MPLKRGNKPRASEPLEGRKSDCAILFGPSFRTTEFLADASKFLFHTTSQTRMIPWAIR